MNSTWKEQIDNITSNTNLILIPQLFERVKNETSISSFYKYMNKRIDDKSIIKEKVFSNFNTSIVYKRGTAKISDRKKYLEILKHEYKLSLHSNAYNTMIDIDKLHVLRVYKYLASQHPNIKTNANFIMDYKYIKDYLTHTKSALSKSDPTIPCPIQIFKRNNLLNLINRGIYLTGSNNENLRFVIFDIYNRLTENKLFSLIKMITTIQSDYGIRTNITINVCVWNNYMKDDLIQNLQSRKELSYQEHDETFIVHKQIIKTTIKIINLDIQRYFGNLYINI